MITAQDIDHSVSRARSIHDSNSCSTHSPLKSSITQNQRTKNSDNNNVGNSTPLIPCKFYNIGTCIAGSNCKFEHQKDGINENLICTFYLKGNCRYGKTCALPHTKPVTTSKSDSGEIHYISMNDSDKSDTVSAVSTSSSSSPSNGTKTQNNHHQQFHHISKKEKRNKLLSTKNPNLRIQTAIFNSNVVNVDKYQNSVKDTQDLPHHHSSSFHQNRVYPLSLSYAKSHYFSLADPRSPGGLPNFGCSPSHPKIVFDDDRDLPNMDDEHLEAPILPSSLKDLLTPIEQLRLSSSCRNYVHLSTAEPFPLPHSPRPLHHDLIGDHLLSPSIDSVDVEIFSLEMNPDPFQKQTACTYSQITKKRIDKKQ